MWRWSPLVLAFFTCFFIITLFIQISPANALYCFKCNYDKDFPETEPCLNPAEDYNKGLLKKNCYADQEGMKVYCNTVILLRGKDIVRVQRRCGRIPEDPEERKCYAKLPLLESRRFTKEKFETSTGVWDKCDEKYKNGQRSAEMGNEMEALSPEKLKADSSGFSLGDLSNNAEAEGREGREETEFDHVEACSCDSDYCNDEGENSGPRLCPESVWVFVGVTLPLLLDRFVTDP